MEETNQANENMANQTPAKKNWCRPMGGKGGACGGIYGLGFIGALVYFLQHFHGFWELLFSFVKAALWPALIVYRILEFFRF